MMTLTGFWRRHKLGCSPGCRAGGCWARKVTAGPQAGSSDQLSGTKRKLQHNISNTKVNSFTLTSLGEGDRGGRGGGLGELFCTELI